MIFEEVFGGRVYQLLKGANHRLMARWIAVDSRQVTWHWAEKNDLALMRTCWRAYYEGIGVLYGSNTFKMVRLICVADPR